MTTTLLTAADLDHIGRARELAAITGSDALCDHTGEADITTAYARAYGEAGFLLAELAAITERLGGTA